MIEKMENLKSFKIITWLVGTLILLTIPTILSAAPEAKAFAELAGELGLAEWALIFVAFVLFIIILLMGAILKRLAYDKYRAEMGAGAKAILIFVFAAIGWFSMPSLAVADSGSMGASWLSDLPLILLVSVIALEVIIILIMLRNIKIVAGLEMKSDSAELAAAGTSIWASLWHAMNKSVSIEKEKDVMLDHAYDGIRELDNDLPPWWKYGFYVTIVFALVYLARYHVFQTAPLQLEEFEIAMARAEAEREARALFAPAINEETVVMLEDEADLERGKAIYVTNCAVCHGQLGEGGIGPNLTDDYWIHGGSINDIFRITKYGVIERGMTPWQDILSPLNIAQVSSYIKTLRGTDPPNQKEPEGDLWIPMEEEVATEEEDIGAAEETKEGETAEEENMEVE
ncbi:MAG: hypothetical protein EA409_04170 [Saprospirales bacterium]|nr:MAG: hypothetical protein EA409_04170 [Saprospirales bacterium]